MTMTPDKVRTHGDWRFTIVSETLSKAQVVGQGVFASGGKWPVAAVFHDGEAFTAFDMRGRPMDMDKLLRKCPDLLSAFDE